MASFSGSSAVEVDFSMSGLEARLGGFVASPIVSRVT
jgi:hypothetical protein